MESHIQILSKADYTQQTLVSLPNAPSTPLNPNSIRVRTKLIALTANNLGYAALGTQLHWWSAFPVPKSAPPPYNDTTAYGIVPSWGYAEVLKSAVSKIPPGALLWGCWPVSTYPTDLRLSPTTPEGHWLETSEHREELMPLYQRYMVTFAPPSPLRQNISNDNDNNNDNATHDVAVERLAKTALLKPLWEAAYLLNRFVFTAPQPLHSPSSSSSSGTGTGTISPIHPFGQGNWTAKDADLTSTTVVILAASSKTARAFLHELRNGRAPRTGPLGVMSVASKIPAEPVDGRGSSASTHPVVPTRQETYGSMLRPPALKWLASTHSSRILIFDFGARFDNAAEQLKQAIHNHNHPNSPIPENNVEITVVGIGAVHKSGQSTQWAGDKIPSNASSTRDAAMERLGAEKYFEGLEEAFGKVLDGEEEEGPPLGLRVEVGKGMLRREGVEGGWGRLCKGDVGERGMVFLI